MAAAAAKKKKAARVGRPPGRRNSPKPDTDAGLDLDRLRAELERQGWSPLELARRTILQGYTGNPSSVRALLDGRAKNPGIKLMKPVAQALGLRIDDLVYPSDASRVEPPKPPGRK